MQQSTQQKPSKIPAWFNAEIIRLFALYPSVRLSSTTIAAWWTVLGRIDQGTIKRSMGLAAAASPEFIPSAMAVLQLAKPQGVLAAERTAALMWPAVAGHFTGSKDKLDEIGLEAVRNMGGFERLGKMDSQEFATWGRKEFERLYVIVAEKQQNDRLQLAAAGDRQLLEENCSG